jgi:hypothetical protein
MTRLVLVSLGSLAGDMLEMIARAGVVDEIVVASRNAAHGRKKVNSARVGAGILGKFPAIRFEAFDFNAPGAGAALARLEPDLVISAPSLMPWWAVAALEGRAAEAARAMTFAGWIACHIAPMLAFREAWADSRLACPWVNASYPDVVNAVLARTGAAPLCGVGNVEEIVPKARIAAAAAVGGRAEDIEARVVVPHAAEYMVYAEDVTRDPPPVLVHAIWRGPGGGRDVSAEARAGLFAPMPIPYRMDFNLLTASAATKLVPALLGPTPTLCHVPGPMGMVGGYPVQAGHRTVALDLAPGWTIDGARRVNEGALVHDGIAGVSADGTVAFTDATRAGLKRLIGRDVATLAPHDAARLAAELLAAADAAGARRPS